MDALTWHLTYEPRAQRVYTDMYSQSRQHSQDVTCTQGGLHAQLSGGGTIPITPLLACMIIREPSDMAGKESLWMSPGDLRPISLTCTIGSQNLQ